MPFEKGHKHARKNVGGTAVDGSVPPDTRTPARKSIDRGRQIIKRLTVVGRVAFIGLEKPSALFDGRPVQLTADDLFAAREMIKEAKALLKYMPGIMDDVTKIADQELSQTASAPAAA